MPTNVTPQYRKAEEAFKQATTNEERIERLEEMIALLPKHKGTDHLFADLKKRLSKLRKRAEQSGRKARRGPALEFSREGAAQVILVGAPNAGKSSVLAALTKATPEVAEYPFATHHPQPGMIPFEDIQIQLIDCPPMTAEFMPMHVQSLVRGADATAIVADLSKDSVLDDLETVFEAFRSRGVVFARESGTQGEDGLLPVRGLVLANKMDALDAEERLEFVREFLDDRLDIETLSCTEGTGVTELPEKLFRFLRIVRVYSKIPGKKADLTRPFTVFRGQTVEDVCERIHRDFVANLRFARLWRGEGADSITVSRHETVEDGDILEVHV